MQRTIWLRRRSMTYFVFCIRRARRLHYLCIGSGWTISFSPVYVAYVLKRSFIEGLTTSTLHSSWVFWRSHEDHPLQRLPYVTTSRLIGKAGLTKLDHMETRTATNKKLLNLQVSQGSQYVNHIHISSSNQFTQSLLPNAIKFQFFITPVMRCCQDARWHR